MKVGDGVPDNRWTGRQYSMRPASISLSLPCSKKQDTLPTQEDLKARFYKHYRKVAEEYDKEFLKKYDEDLNTTLIFVSITTISV